MNVCLPIGDFAERCHAAHAVPAEQGPCVTALWSVVSVTTIQTPNRSHTQLLLVFLHLGSFLLQNRNLFQLLAVCWFCWFLSTLKVSDRNGANGMWRTSGKINESLGSSSCKNCFWKHLSQTLCYQVNSMVSHYLSICRAFLVLTISPSIL